MITIDTRLIGTTDDNLRMSDFFFEAMLKDAESPAANEAIACYDAISEIAGNQTAMHALALAIFHHESNYGKKGVVETYNTKNPGNCRTKQLRKLSVGYMNVPNKGSFVKYKSWADGFRDLAWRLIDPAYVYRQNNANTARQIFKIWAPASDNNDPGSYANAVVNDFNTWMGEMTVPLPTQKDIGYPVRVHYAADLGPYRDLTAITEYIVHDTEGYPVGDEEILTAASKPIESAHALILPDGTLIHMVDLDTTAWTPGNDAVAKISINVELSGFRSVGYTEEQYRSLAGHFVWCRKVGMTNVPPVYVARSGRPGILGHQDVPDPNDPSQYGGASHHVDPGSKFDWVKFVGIIKQLSGTQPDPADNRWFPETQHYVSHGFKGYWESKSDAIEVFGYPISKEFTLVSGLVVQYFERARFEWHPGSGVNQWDVMLGRLGSEVTSYVYGDTKPEYFAPEVAPA